VVHEEGIINKLIVVLRRVIVNGKAFEKYFRFSRLDRVTQALHHGDEEERRDGVSLANSHGGKEHFGGGSIGQDKEEGSGDDRDDPLYLGRKKLKCL